MNDLEGDEGRRLWHARVVRESFTATGLACCVALAACASPPAPIPSVSPPAPTSPKAIASGSNTNATKPLATPGSADVQALARLAETPGTTLAGVWLRRLAAAYRVTKDATAPEVEVASDELSFAIEWVSLDERKKVLEGAVALAPVFENGRAPIPSRLPPSDEPPSDYRAAKAAADAAIRPAVVALYTNLGADGRRGMLFGLENSSTFAEFFAVSAHDDVCPSIRDDRDLGWAAWRSPVGASCLPPSLPGDELHDLERLSAELPGPWPRAVRAIAALRDMRDHERAKFTPTLAQQKRFVEGCLKHPMCPLWLLDKPDPGLRPMLEEAKKTATAAQLVYLDRALAESRGKGALAPKSATDAERDVTECVDRIAKDLAAPGEPWMKDARAGKRRRGCLDDAGLVRRDALLPLVSKADLETAAALVEAVLTVDKRAKLAPADLARLAADVRTRIVLYRALSSVKRESEMPAEARKHEALLESEAVATIRRRYGQVPTTLERQAPSKMTLEKRPVTFEYYRVSSGAEYASVAPFEVAVGPFRPNQPYEPHHESGSDWGTESRGLRKLVEEHFGDPRSVSFFENYR